MYALTTENDHIPSHIRIFDKQKPADAGLSKTKTPKKFLKSGKRVNFSGAGLSSDGKPRPEH